MNRNSDHHLVIAYLRLKLKKSSDSSKSKRKVFNTELLNEHDIQRKFSIELRNRFRILENLEQEEDNPLEESGKTLKRYTNKLRRTLQDIGKEMTKNGYPKTPGTPLKKEQSLKRKP